VLGLRKQACGCEVSGCVALLDQPPIVAARKAKLALSHIVTGVLLRKLMSTYREEQDNQDFPAAPPDAQTALIGPTIHAVGPISDFCASGKSHGTVLNPLLCSVMRTIG
jgi:hypothetical protein